MKKKKEKNVEESFFIGNATTVETWDTELLNLKKLKKENEKSEKAWMKWAISSYVLSSMKYWYQKKK